MDKILKMHILYNINVPKLWKKLRSLIKNVFLKSFYEKQTFY